jgi:hypothetical protein
MLQLLVSRIWPRVMWYKVPRFRRQIAFRASIKVCHVCCPVTGSACHRITLFIIYHLPMGLCTKGSWYLEETSISLKSFRLLSISCHYRIFVHMSEVSLCLLHLLMKNYWDMPRSIVRRNFYISEYLLVYLNLSSLNWVIVAVYVPLKGLLYGHNICII